MEQRIHRSADMQNVPKPGTEINMLSEITPQKRSSDSERLAALVENVSAENFELNKELSKDVPSTDKVSENDFDDGDDDNEDEFDLDSILDSLESENAQSDSTKKDSISAEDKHKNTDIDTEDESESDSNSKLSIVKYIAVGIIILVVIIACVIKGILGSKNSLSSSDGENNSTTVSVSSEAKYNIDTVNIADSSWYQDSMTIDKYVVLDKDACLYVFEGYAENARAFVKAYVDVNVYNIYKKGARVPIVYRRVELNGENYYMEVKVILDEDKDIKSQG